MTPEQPWKIWTESTKDQLTVPEKNPLHLDGTSDKKGTEEFFV